MYINIGNTGNYLILRLKGCLTLTGRSNNDGIGARIKFQRDGNTPLLEKYAAAWVRVLRVCSGSTWD